MASAILTVIGLAAVCWLIYGAYLVVDRLISFYNKMVGKSDPLNE